MTSSPVAGLNHDALWSKDRVLQGAEFQRALTITNERVEWSYDAWDTLVEKLRSPDNHDRAIAAQLLARLAISDPKKRIMRDFDQLITVTRDRQFVTARHALQSLWRVGIPGESPRTRLVSALELRFAECTTEKNCTLVRYDIIESLRKLYDAVGDETVKTTALQLIEQEEDVKYKKKYATLWRK
jgi:hypothetical protein